ncbi:MAG: septum formation initiator family protein [Acidobacteria bacterium]|nr:septum formation initiator family protein [Acidobacteriota bacterium]
MLTSLFLMLVAYQVFGANGIVALRHRKQEEIEWRARNEALQRQNGELGTRIHGLRTDPKAIEKIAREDMMLAGPGDRVIVTPDKK